MKAHSLLLSLTLIVAGCSSVGVQPLESKAEAADRPMKAYVRFTPGSSGDFELYINEALTAAGVSSQIQYPGEPTPTDCEWYVVYADDTGFDLARYLKLLEISIHQCNSSKLLGTAKFESSYFHGFSNPRKKAFDLVSQILGKKIPYQEPDAKPPGVSYGKTWNISVYIKKQNRNTYTLSAEGAGARSLQEVQQAILMHARKVANGRSFKYAWRSEQYTYGSSGPVNMGGAIVPMNFAHQGERVFATIEIQDDLAGKETEIASL